jgi:predicted nucleic acid-binding protein
LKFIFDTNVYFSLLHERSVLERLATSVAAVGPRLYLSSIVSCELLQGARGELGRARVRRATRQLERIGRVIAPSHSDWVRAGRVQSKIWDDRPDLLKKSLQNDLLIACSAARVGAIVVTSNTDDFELIRRYVMHHAIGLNELGSSIE